MLTYHASSVSDAESDIFCLLYCMNLSYCHIYNRTSWHTADCILKYAVLRILSEDTPSGRLYSIFRISYYSTLLLLYDIILPVYRHSGISGMSYDYHTFTGLFWHIFIIYPGNPPQLSTSCPGNRTYGLCGWFPDCRDPVFAIRHPVFTAFIRVCLSHIWIVWMPSGRRGVSPSGTIYLPSHIMGQNIYWYRLMLPHPHTPSK